MPVAERSSAASSTMTSAVMATSTSSPGRERCFQSVAHPRGASAALVYSRAMARPLGAVLVPVMLAVLASVLVGQRIWPHFLWAAGAALAGAWAWAHFQIGRTPAEVRVRPEQHTAAVQSVGDVLHGTAPDWHRAARLRVERYALRLDLGDTSHRLLTHRWPEAPALEDTLRRAL